MSKLVGQYQNGNYTVSIYSDGTKVRENNLDNLTPDFAESIDMTITKRCDGGCPFCYAGCTIDGNHGDLRNLDLLNSLHPYTEVALNGNDLTHPDLYWFLSELKSRRVIANITVRQKHFLSHRSMLRFWAYLGLVHGIGVSFDKQEDSFIPSVLGFQNAVVHTIAGITTLSDYKYLSGHGLKVLVLGYKNTGRGKIYAESNGSEISANIQELKSRLEGMIDGFDNISFDNLAIDQLGVRDWGYFKKNSWNDFYMGDEGKYTFYLDLVDKVFAVSSLESGNNTYPMFDNVDDMFQFIRTD